RAGYGEVHPFGQEAGLTDILRNDPLEKGREVTRRGLMDDQRYLPHPRLGVHHAPDLRGKYASLNLDLYVRPGRSRPLSSSRCTSKPAKHLLPLAAKVSEPLTACE